MKPVASNDQMREADRLTIEEIGIPGMVLMETASRAVALKARGMLGGNCRSKRVICICGKGNNGGDGLAVSRHLTGWGIEVVTYLLCPAESLRGDAAHNYEILHRVGGRIDIVATVEDARRLLLDCDLIIDAILGTGFVPPANELYSAIIQRMNQSGKPILSVDIPSGVAGEDGWVEGEAVHATATVTFAMLKPGLLLSPGRDYVGELSVADIGIPPMIVNRQSINCHLVEASDVHKALPLLKSNAHKGDAGIVYLLAGSPGLTGAATMAAESAMRTGAGLVTVGVPRSLNSILEMKLTEPMTEPLDETESGGLSIRAWNTILARLPGSDAVAFGPGVGRHPETGELLAKLLIECLKPMVIDADGLYLLAGKPELFQHLSGKTVLTPHTGEFARLTGLPLEDIRKNPVDRAREFAVKWGTVLHLKGAPSITASPSGDVFFNSTGNNGMATGGSGDVLTGVIVSLLAAGLDPATAAWAGSYVHGVAGDLARAAKGVRGMTALDIIHHLPSALLS